MKYVIRQQEEGGRMGKWKILDASTGEVIVDDLPTQQAAKEKKAELESA
jgi:hypothetical protein